MNISSLFHNLRLAQIRVGEVDILELKAIGIDPRLKNNREGRSMQARNRNLDEWYGKIKHSQIKLPRFQRFEAWDRQRICSLVETVIHNLPLGITLVLQVGDNEKFISRYS